MANISGMYDPNAAPQAEFGAIPTGEYEAVMIESDLKDVKPPKTGKYLETVYEITSGEYKKRKLWHNVTLNNPSAQAVEIGNRQMASIREATGVMNAEDSQEFHYKPMLIRVEFIPAGTEQKNGYVTNKDTNEIKSWKKADGTVASGPSAPTPANQATGTATPPWQRSAA